MPPAGYPAFLQYLQSGRVRNFMNQVDATQAGKTICSMPSSRLGGNRRHFGASVLDLQKYST